MRPFAFLTAALAVLPGVIAVDVTKSVIVWFEKDNTPASIINKAKKAITDAGGKITHVYDLIQGFSALAPEESLEEVKIQCSSYEVRVEEDQVVSTN
ncbi:hypothetical protein BGZ63DRAFT_367057 [Mariannaea sp. PMI_226]|nr:hypothetical protein BGZ63DRAFT_367057 [Mariannaea sp. PMI_226]